MKATHQRRGVRNRRLRRARFPANKDNAERRRAFTHDKAAWRVFKPAPPSSSQDVRPLRIHRVPGKSPPPTLMRFGGHILRPVHVQFQLSLTSARSVLHSDDPRGVESRYPIVAFCIINIRPTGLRTGISRVQSKQNGRRFHLRGLIATKTPLARPLFG